MGGHIEEDWEEAGYKEEENTDIKSDTEYVKRFREEPQKRWLIKIY